MTIIRDGKQITLTDEEVRTASEENHKRDLRYEIEEALRGYEENGDISFSCWQEVSFADYDSEDDARADFIEGIVEHLIEMEDMDERSPVRGRYDHNYDAEVWDTAEDYGYTVKGE